MADSKSKTSRQPISLWQFGLMSCAGGLIGQALLGPHGWLGKFDLGTQNLILLGIVTLVVAIANFGAIICHQLYEINDQLSGRSPEFMEWLGKR